MKRGFTIAELLVVLVVIAILMILALPSYKSFMVAARRGEAKIILNTSVLCSRFLKLPALVFPTQ